MKTLKLLMSTAILTIAFCVTVMAGTWKSDANGWWFDDGTGNFPKNTWSWIDGNNDGVSECYYFDQNGYCLINTITPDNYYVNINGAWTIDGTTQTRGTVMSGSMTNTGDNHVDVVTEKLSIGEKKKKDTKKSKSSNKSSKKNQDEDDDYDDEDEIEEEDDDNDEDDSNDQSEKKSSKKSDGKTVNFTNNMDMFDLKTESSNNFYDYSPSQSLRGESWEGCKKFHAIGGYAEYYIGGNYKKLTIKLTPSTYNDDFRENGATIITITNAETGEELCTKRITHATKIETLTADVTDVKYVRIDSDRISGDYAFAAVLMKDAILTK